MGKHDPKQHQRPRLSGVMILKTRWSIDGHQKGTKVERHLTAKALLHFYDSGGMFVPVRVIRENQIRHVQHASPGARLSFEGHWKTGFEELEFHILKCALLQQATFLPGDEAYERPDGTWRFMSPSALASKPLKK